MYDTLRAYVIIRVSLTEKGLTMDKQCLICQKTFRAKRASAKYCSEACKQKSKRQVDELEPITLEQEPTTIVCPKCKYAGYNPQDKWSHSACYRTQAEIEGHYTQRNYPRVLYGKSISPYPKSDRRYYAYADAPVA